MYIVTSKKTNVIYDFAENIPYLENGYPVFRNEKNEETAYPPELFNTFNVEINTIERKKYCYSKEKGIFLNPDWAEPDPDNIYGISDNVFLQIKNGLANKIAKEVSQNGEM